MVKNRGHITLVRIFVLVTFLLTVVLELKSETKENFYVHSETSTDKSYYHSLFKETAQTQSLLYFIPVKKRNYTCLFHPECAGYTELNWQHFSYPVLPGLSNYILTFKIRGFNPINGPPLRACSSETTENHKLCPKAISPSFAGSRIRISNNILPVVNESPLLFASLNDKESVVYATSGSNKNHPVIVSGAAPQLECPEDISTYTDINECSAFIASGLNPGFDETEVVALTWEMFGATSDASPAQGINLIDDYTFPEGTTIITYTATGTDGATTTCTFTVTISDNQVPRLESIPADINVETAPGTCSATVFWIEPTATDNCTSPHLILKEGIARLGDKAGQARPGDIFSVGTTRVFYTAYDGMGNPSQTESFTITVKDTEPPVLSLPSDVTMACGDPLPAPWQTLQQLTNAEGSATDNCPEEAISFRLLSETTSSPVCPYVLTSTYQATDAAGNTATAEHRIVVEGEDETVQPEQEEEVQLKSGMAEIISTSTGGNWNDPNTWVGNVVPGAGDNVTIATGATVTVNTGAFCDNILIETGGILNHGGAYTLQVNGNWTNNGTYNGGTNGIVEFVGTSNAIISGTTTFEELVISKGSMSTLLNIAGDVTVGGGGSLIMNGGLVIIASGNSLSLDFSNGITIEETAGFDVTGGTLITGNFTITNEGLIRVSSGTANLGTNSGNSVNNQYDAAFIVSGGALNIAGRLHNSASGTLNPPNVSSGIHITGGTVTLSTAGQSLSNVGSLNVTAAGTFNFTGGTIVFQNPSTASTELDLGLIGGGGTKNTEGGTFQFGNASTPAGSVFNISSEIPLDDLTTEGNASLILENDLVISGLLTLNGNSRLLLNDHTLQIPVTGTGTYDFQLADGTGNAIPVSIQFTGGSFAPGAYVEIFTSDTKHPENANTANYLNRYWAIATSGITNPVYNVTADYHNNDISGSISGFIVGDYTGSAWNETGNATIGGGTISITGINQANFEFTALSEPTVIASSTEPIICYGASTSLTATATGDPIVSYSWTPVTGLNNPNIANPVATLNSTVTYTVTVTDENGFTAEDQITITVYDEFSSGKIASTGQTICYNENPGIIGNTTSASGGDGNIEYQWQSSPDGSIWTDIAGSNSESFDPSNLTATTHYRRLAKDGTCNGFEASSDTWIVTVRPEFEPGAIETSGETICYGGLPSQIGSITNASGGDENIIYEWRSSADAYSSAISGATAATYTPPAGLTSTTSYRRYAQDGTCNTLPTQSAGTWTVTVRTELLAGSVSSAHTICYNTAPEALVATAATGGSGPYAYQWQSSPAGSTWTNISGQTSLVYNLPALTSSTHYRIIATDTGSPSCGSVESNDVQITVTPLLEATASATSVDCYNGSATVTISASGGTPPYSYTFNGIADADGIINNVVAGTYSWSVTDANTCGPVTGTIEITEPTPISNLSANVTSPITCNSGTGTVTIGASGGTGTLSYTFNGQTNTTGIFTGVYAGTGLAYSVSDENGCGPVFGSIDVTEPPAITGVTAEVSSLILCNGETATVTISASGGTAPLSYTFNSVTNSTGVFTGISPGTNIPWSVTDANGCGPVTGTLTVTQPNDLTASVSETASITCFGGTANIRITASGGTGIKTWSFEGQPDNTTGEFPGITAGIYNWRVEDENGCFEDGTYEVQQPTQVEITSIGSNSEICQGQTLTLNSTAEGGTGNRTFSWTGPNGFTSNSPNPSLASATPAASGTYTLIVSDANNCIATATTDVVVHATPTMNIPADIEDCHGTDISAITITGASDSYAWEIDDPSIGFATNSGTDVIPAFTMDNTGNSPVTATVTITPSITGGCEGLPQTFTIIINPIPNVAVTNSAPIICNNGSTSILLNSDVEGVVFDWHATRISGVTTGFSSGTGTNIVQALSGAGFIEYEITPRTIGPNNCSGAPVVVVVEVISTTFDWGIVTSGPNATEFCNGYSFSLDFSGSPNGSGEGGDEWYSTYHYQMQTRFEWNVSNLNITSPVSGVMDNPGILSFTVNNISDIDQDAIISISSLIYIRSRTRNRWWHNWGDWSSWEQLCAGGTYTTNITVYPFRANCPDDYVVTADAGTCTATFTPDPPTFECSPQTLTWSMSDGSSGNGNIGSYAFETGTTTVTYEAQDDQGNTSTCSFTVTVTDDEAPVISGCPTDFNVSMDAGECGAVITWTEPTIADNCDVAPTLTRTDGTGYNSGDLFPAGSTTISYLATDAAGNTSTCSFDIIVAPDDEPPVWTCIGDQTECASTGSPYTMIGDAWDPEVTENCSGTLTKSYTLSGATTGTGTSLNNVEFGVGTTTVTWTATDVNGNSSTCQFDVVINEMPAVSITEGDQSICLNGSVTFSATASGTPAPTFQWYKDGVELTGETGTTLTIGTVAETDAGSYTVEVSNSCGAAISAPATLTVSTPPVITKQPASQSDCRGNSVVFSVVVTGGNTPYTYSWEMMRPSETWIPASGEPNISFPAPGEMQVDNSGNPDNPDQTQYRVTVSDACGNSETSALATLTVNEVEDVDLVLETICQGEGTSFTAITSGSTPVSFEWIKHTGPGVWDPVVDGGPYSGATTATLTINNATPAESGEYSVRAIFNITVPNNNGSSTCRETNYTQVGVLTVDAGPDIVATATPSTICSGGNVEIKIYDANGTPGNTFTWSRTNTTALAGSFTETTVNDTLFLNGTLTSTSPGTELTTTFNITGTSPNGCESTGTVDIVVVDDEAPVVTPGTCPNDISVGAGAGICGAVITYTPPTFDDNCDGAGLPGTLVAGLASGETFPVETTTVTYEYTDAAGNGPATCTFDVTVTDDVDPVAVCQDITVQLDASGIATITPDDVDNGSSDNCGIDNLSLDITSFDCTNLGENTVTLTATDTEGNSHSCTATVTVADDDNPVDIAASISQEPILCYGETTTVTISATGGVGDLTYTFDGETNDTGVFTAIPAGTDYSWSVTDEFGCGDTDGLFDVTQVDELAANLAATEVTCSSGNDGSIILSDFQGGSGNYEFSIDGGSTWQSDPAFLNLVPGIYNVQMRDADATGCVKILHDALEVFIITANVASTDITCYDADDGTITVSNPDGGTSPYQYSVDGGVNWQASGDFTGLQQGTYDVRIQDNTGCEIVLDPAVELNQPDVLTATVASTDISCNGAADGTITISSPSGGSGNFDYSVDGGTDWQASGDFTGLTPGTYVVVIRDADVPSCEVVLDATFEISELPEITASIDFSDVTCFGESDGSITISSLTGGSGNYEFTIDGGTTWQTDPLFENLAAGTYNVQVRDASATVCVTELDDAFVISQPPALTIDTQPVDAMACDSETVTFSVVNSGGGGTISYRWEKEISGVWTALSDGGDISGATSANLVLTNISTGDNGNYRVIITDNCSSVTSDEVTLTVNEITAVTPVNLNAEICEGDDYTFEVTTSGEAPTGYQWQINTSGTWNDITDNGIFAGTATNTLTLTGATPAENGQYRVVVTFPASGGADCSLDSESFERHLLVKPAPIVDALPDSLFYCQGETTTAIPLTGSPSGVVFDITGGSGVGLYDQSGVTQIPSYLAVPGTATVTITPRANGCTGIPANVVIEVSPMPTVSVAPLNQTICSGGTTNINLSSNLSGAEFSWTTTVTPADSVTGATDVSDTIVSKLEQTLVNTTSSQATVVYRISAMKDGCPGPAVNVTITVQPGIDLTITEPSGVCSPETVDITYPSIVAGSTSGLNYTFWLNASATNSHPNPTAATAGTYYIKGTDPSTNCSRIEPVIVTINPSPTLVINQPSPICAPGTIDLTDTGITAGSDADLTFTYWEDAAATIPYPNPAVAEDGTYYIMGETAEGCYDIQPVTVDIYTTLTTPEFLAGNYSYVCKGSPPVTYTATAENMTGISYELDAASIAAGNSINPATGEVTFAPGYTGTIKVIANATGCSDAVQAIHSINVIEPPSVTLSVSDNSICEGESVTLTATNSNGTTFKEYSGSATVNQSIPDNSTTGVSSSINLSGSGGAILLASDILIVTLNIEHTRTSDIDIFLVDPSGTRAIMITRDRGGNGDNYENTVFRTEAVTPIQDGIAPFNGTFLPQRAMTATSNSGAAQGAGGETYSATIPNPALVGAPIDGDWTLWVFDDNTNQLGTLLDWSLSIVKETESEYGTVFNGPGTTGNPIANTSVATEVITPPAGNQTYTATTTDENGCSTTSNQVNVTVNETPDAFIAADYCSIDGKIELTALGGAPGATYLWSTGETSQAIVVDEVNIYSVTITNPNGCSATDYLDVSNELVVNGDFEAGNTGFSSAYGFRNPYLNSPPADAPSSGTPGSSLWPENLYGIGTNARYYHTNFWGQQDHTSGDGNFMIVNGYTDSGVAIWEQTVNVEPNTNYYFSAWAMSLNSAGNDAVLQFEVNGVLVGSLARLSPGVSNNSNNGWIRFYSDPLWNSGSVSGPITIRIRNVEPAAGGNDFGLDDISFGTLDPLPLELNVTANEVCEGDTLFLVSNSVNGLEPITYFWTGPNGWTSSDPNPYIANITLADAGEYKLEATDGYGCDIIPDSVDVVVNIAPTVNAGDNQEVCSANPVVILNGSIGGSAISATWSGSGGTFDDNTLLDASYTLSTDEVTAGLATLVLTTDDPAGACEAVTDTMFITIFNSLEITSIDFVEPLCNSVPDGTATANVILGTQPYEYLWSDGQTTQIATDLAAGEYWVQVTDANGCTDSDTIIITEPEPFVISPTTPQIFAPSCFNAGDGMAVVEVSGGIPPYVFQWDAAAGSQTTDTAFYLSAGTYTVFVTDSAGCAATTIPVTIPNPPPPTLTCPPDAEDIIHDDGCGITFSTIENPVVTGFCFGDTTYVRAGATSDSGNGLVNNLEFNVGTTVVEYTVADTVGNALSCSFEVTVRRLEIPEAAYDCPASLHEFDVDAGTCEADVTLDAPNIIDLCNEIDLVWNNSPYRADSTDASGIYPVGPTNFKWYITDVSGNIDSCEVTVIVNDTIVPYITCPPSVTDDAADNLCSKVPATLTDPVYGDDCSDVTLTWEMTGATSGNGSGTVTDSTFNVGVTTVTYTVTDENGNTAECSFDVTIVDVTDPVITLGCESVSDSAAYNNCSKVSAKLIEPEFEDNCWPDSTLTLTWVMTGATEGSGTGSVTDSTFNVGVTTVVYTVTDPDGNFATCEFTVTIVDVTPPNLAMDDCQDVEETADADNCSKTGITITNPTYSDDCWPNDSLTFNWTMTGATVGLGTGYVAAESFNIGVTTVTYTVTDPDDNEASCSFDVTIIHLEVPEMAYNCPTPAVVETDVDPGTCDAYVSLDAIEIIDPCGEIDNYWNNSPYRTDSTDASGTYPVGSTVFHWYITDISGNIDSCRIEVIVNDTIPPSLTCPPDITESADFGENYASGVYPADPTATDNCGSSELTWTMAPPVGFVGEYDPALLFGTGIFGSTDTFYVGVTTITYTFADSTGNSVSCDFTITIEAAPVIECPPSDTFYVDNSGCIYPLDPGIPSVISGAPPFDWTWTMEGANTGAGSTDDANLPAPIGVIDFNLGETTITWTAENASGADTCFHIITVIDTIPPTFTSADFEDCVDPLHSATYDPNNPNPFVNHVDPNLIKYPVDFRTFETGSIELDITDLADNCCDPATMIINWRIDFSNTPDPLVAGNTINHASISGTGQPSTYGSDIELWGDGVFFNPITHTITYWVEDCNGNTSIEQVRNIEITPRPQITKENY